MNKRILKEQENLLKAIADDPTIGIGAVPDDNNIRKWRAAIVGPAGTPFEGGWLEFSIDFPKRYPFQPPVIKIVHKAFHPNFYSNGNICLDILSSKWTPSYRIGGVLTSLRSLLNDPNPDSPANVDAAKAYKKWQKDSSDTTYADAVRETMRKAQRYKTEMPEWYRDLHARAKAERESILDNNATDEQPAKRLKKTQTNDV